MATPELSTEVETRELPTEIIEKIIYEGNSADLAAKAAAVCSFWRNEVNAIIASPEFKPVLREQLSLNISRWMAKTLPPWASEVVNQDPSNTNPPMSMMRPYIKRQVVDSVEAARMLMLACVDGDAIPSDYREQACVRMATRIKAVKVDLCMLSISQTAKPCGVVIRPESLFQVQEDPPSELETHRLRVQLSYIYQLQDWCAAKGWPGLFRRLCHVLVSQSLVPSSAFVTWSKRRSDATADRGKIEALLEVQGWLVHEEDVLAQLHEEPEHEEEEEEEQEQVENGMSVEQREAIDHPRAYSADQITALGLEWICGPDHLAATAAWVLVLSEPVEAE